jgi:hypothetical protein
MSARLDMLTKLTIEHKYVEESYIINILCLLHVSATRVAIVREVNYKNCTYHKRF